MSDTLDPSPYRVGAILRASRDTFALSATEAAERLVVDHAEYRAWERGEAMPPEWLLSHLEAIVESRLARVLESTPQVDLRPLADTDAAFDAWKATCGPAALAAALGRTSVDSLRHAFAPFKGYTDVAKMRTAIDRVGARIVREWSRPDKREVLCGEDGARLVVILRWHVPGLPPRAAARHRHAIAYVRGFVGHAGPGWIGDGNVEGTWAPARWWAARIPKALAPKRWDGETIIDWAAEVVP